MITRTHAAATLLTAGLVAGAASLVTVQVTAQDASGPNSSDLYKKGVELLQAGSLKEAKETLERVDPLQLPEGDRAGYFAALKKSDPAGAKPAEKPQDSTPPPEKGGDALSGARAGEQAALVAAGDDAMAKNLYAKAAQNYAKAHELAPEDADIAKKLAAAQSEQSKHAGTPLAVDLQRYEVEHQKVISEFNADMEDAKTHLAARDYVGASRMASVARAHANQGREWLSVSEYEAMKGKVGELVTSIDAAQLQSGIEKKLQDGMLKKRDASTVASEDKAMRVNQLLLTARALQRNGQNAQALNAAEQALAADPGNMAAEMLTEMLRDELYLRKSDRLLKEKYNHIAQLGLENREAVIPYTDLINYPTDWPQLSERRITAATGASIESEIDRNTRHLLDEKIIETASFNGDSLETALNYVRDATGVNMVVVWGSIEQTGIKRDRAVTQPLKRVSAAQLLKTILELVSSDQEGESKLGYAIDNGVVKVSTRKDLKTTTTENIYDIHDLLVQVPNFTDAPSFSLTSALSSSGGAGGGGGADIFKDTSASPEAPDENKTVEELITRIKEHVGTKAEWDDNLSVISAYHSQLLVKTTPENHRALARLLESFRQTRSVQISVESRFLFVDNNFLEEFGVDMDFTFAGNNGLSPISVQQGSAPAQTSGGAGIAARPTGTLTPAAFKSATAGGAVPQALTLGASYLSDLQVDLLVTATQARQTGITLTAPRITFFNGQRAYVLVGRQVAFVSDLTPIQNTSSAKATISTVQSGVVLDVEGTTSSDRRYVTLTLRPSLATLKDPMRQIEIRAANQINNFGNNGTNNNNNGVQQGNGTATVLGVVEAPELELTQVRTTVSIPDRGTLMTGGQRLISETTVEAGVPVLSKIPIIDRLFTNSSQVKDERTLLILIKPTIILQNEEEENRWPGGPQDWSAFNTTATPQVER